MHSATVMWLVLLTTSVVGVATWAAVATITYDWGSEHTGVKRALMFLPLLSESTPIMTVAATPFPCPGVDLSAIPLKLGSEVSVLEGCSSLLKDTTPG